MYCKICGSNSIDIIYNDSIRNGVVGRSTENPVSIYQCNGCGTIFHKNEIDYDSKYKSGMYRHSMGENSRLSNFYNLHDEESLEKFRYTGTRIFRDKIVADVGCGGGAFMDYISTVTKEIICIEPDASFREEIKNTRPYVVFPDMQAALEEYANRVDVLVSFDVIEHVEDPLLFLEQAFHLLSDQGGTGIIGTPTDAPIMRQLLGKDYERFLFSVQHPWIISRRGFECMAEKIGIKDYTINFYQRYGLGNMLYWLLNKAPGRHVKYDFISDGLNSLWKHELERQELADYIVFEFKHE